MYLTHGPADRIVDTLRISEREAADILDALNGSQHDLPSAELRDSDRLACRPNRGLVVQIQHPGGSGGLFLVWPRNISRTGMSFLHGNFIYPNTPIMINLRKPSGPPTRIMGKIMRCRHIGGILHEIGVRFDQALDMALLAQYSRNEQPSSGSGVSAPAQTKLNGRVLVIDDSIDDRELLSFICTNCGLECTEAAMLEEAKGFLANHMFDLVVTDVELNDGSMDQIVKELRISRYPGPVIGVWQAANQRFNSATLEQAGFSDLLTKPLEMPKVTALLAKHLPQTGGPRRVNEALLSEQWSNDQMRPLILAFLGRLDAQVARLGALATRQAGEDIDSSLLKLCMDLQSTSGSYGYPTISDAVLELHRLANDPQTQAGQLKVQLDRLTTLVRSACMIRHRALSK